MVDRVALLIHVSQDQHSIVTVLSVINIWKLYLYGFVYFKLYAYFEWIMPVPLKNDAQNAWEATCVIVVLKANFHFLEEMAHSKYLHLIGLQFI